MEETKQTQWSFDKETIRKILKGMGITAMYAVAVFVLSLTQGIDFGNALINGIIVQAVPTLINSLKEWKKGEMPQY